MTGEQDIVHDVTLLRERRERAAAPKRSRPKKSSRTSGSKKKSGPKKRRTGKGTPNNASGGPDAETRMRHILSLTLGLCGLLLFLALVSYSRLDQANADISPLDLGGLLSNDPLITGRAEATVNWLGLVGAYLANTLINGTIGWFSFALPGLLIAWGVAVYRSVDPQRVWQKTLQIIGAAFLSAALFATISSISWTAPLPYEWSGAVGGFMGALFGGLIGSAGAFLVFSTGLIILALYLFETNLKGAVDRIGALGGTVGTATRSVATRVWSLASDEIKAPRSKRRSGGGDTVNEPATRVDPLTHEPAHMIRRVREANPQSEAATEVVKVEPPPTTPRVQRKSEDPNSVTPKPTSLEDVSPPGAETRSNVSTKAEGERAAPERKAGVSGIAPSSRELSDATPDQTRSLDKDVPEEEVASSASENIDTVTLSRAPLEEFQQGDAGTLRVHVEEGDTDDDQEIEAEGNIIDRLKDEQIVYDPPTIEMLNPQESHEEVEDEELKTHARLLQEKLRTFNIEIEDLTVTPGPVVTLFEFVPAAGIKLSQIESLGDDIALALKARGIRIIAPIPGKGTVGVEIPNTQPALVRIRSVLNTTKFREAEHNLPLALGKTTVGEVFCADLAKMPHLLIAGATGAGKSVGINSILVSLLYKMHPSDLKLAIIDPKKIELTQYKQLIDHYLVECPDIDEDIVTDPQNAVILLKSLELEMDRRYDMLAKSGQRNLFDYNRKIEDGSLKPSAEAQHRKLPYIVLIIDELADLMITAAKEVEEPIARLAQLARAIGIHIIVATQRPSVDVLTGMIKANFPARIAYQVATKIDSRTILDMNGAEQLLGNGDMLYLPGGRPKPVRLQNAFITTEEVESICSHIGEQTGYSNPYALPSVAEKKKQAAVSSIDERDDLFDEAARIIVRHQQGSVSLLQRRLKVGYARAARIVDELEDAGIVGPFDGSKARAVMLESEAELEAFL